VGILTLTFWLVTVAGPPLRFCKGEDKRSLRPDFPPVTADLIVPTFTRERKGGPAAKPLTKVDIPVGTEIWKVG
jgi:hypothetical protein